MGVNKPRFRGVKVLIDVLGVIGVTGLKESIEDWNICFLGVADAGGTVVGGRGRCNSASDDWCVEIATADEDALWLSCSIASEASGVLQPDAVIAALSLRTWRCGLCAGWCNSIATMCALFVQKFTVTCSRTRSSLVKSDRQR